MAIRRFMRNRNGKPRPKQRRKMMRQRVLLIPDVAIFRKSYRGRQNGHNPTYGDPHDPKSTTWDVEEWT